MFFINARITIKYYIVVSGAVHIHYNLIVLMYSKHNGMSCTKSISTLTQCCSYAWKLTVMWTPLFNFDPDTSV